jgi:hypothetical protein
MEADGYPVVVVGAVMAAYYREMIGFAAERLMELEVDGPTGAAWGEKSPERLGPAQRLPRPGLGDAGRHGRAARRAPDAPAARARVRAHLRAAR